MSRAYRIRVSERLQRIEHLEDGVVLQLEILDILPRPEMAQRLAAALKARGLEPVDGEPDILEIRPEEGVTIRVNVQSGQVEARVEGQTEIDLKREATTHVESVETGTAKLKKDVQHQLEREATQLADEARQGLTDKLEEHLAEIRPVLDRAVNEATASALKTRAAQLGEVESIEEDQDTGGLVIRVKV